MREKNEEFIPGLILGRHLEIQLFSPIRCLLLILSSRKQVFCAIFKDVQQIRNKEIFSFSFSLQTARAVRADC